MGNMVTRDIKTMRLVTTYHIMDQKQQRPRILPDKIHGYHAVHEVGEELKINTMVKNGRSEVYKVVKAFSEFTYDVFDQPPLGSGIEPKWEECLVRRYEVKLVKVI